MPSISPSQIPHPLFFSLQDFQKFFKAERNWDYEEFPFHFFVESLRTNPLITKEFRLLCGLDCLAYSLQK